MRSGGVSIAFSSASVPSLAKVTVQRGSSACRSISLIIGLSSTRSNVTFAGMDGLLVPVYDQLKLSSRRDLGDPSFPKHVCRLRFGASEHSRPICLRSSFLEQPHGS